MVAIRNHETEAVRIEQRKERRTARAARPPRSASNPRPKIPPLEGDPGSSETFYTTESDSENDMKNLPSEKRRKPETESD